MTTSLKELISDVVKLENFVKTSMVP